jgi:exodeoxyribonuclease VIII
MRKDNIPMAEYRQMPGLSKHELDNFSLAPSYYKYKKSQEWKPSRSMEIGTLIHSLVLEGRTDYAVGPQVDKRTKAGKEQWQEFCEDNLGKIIITEDEERTVLGCLDACMPLLERCEYDSNCDIETSLFWERDEIACKGRPDMIAVVNGKLAIVDLKTTNDIKSFQSKFWAFRYDIQAAWYQYGLAEAAALSEFPEFWFLVVDTESPHLAQLQLASTGLLERANVVINNELDFFKQCQITDEWPGLPQTKIILPRYNG